MLQFYHSQGKEAKKERTSRENVENQRFVFVENRKEKLQTSGKGGMKNLQEKTDEMQNGSADET